MQNLELIRQRPALFDSLVVTLAEGLGPQPEENEPVEPGFWPDTYVNSGTGKVYTPHHSAERDFVYEDFPRYGLAKGGEGGGKSVSTIIKDLERLRRGMSGVMVSPDFEHFKKSLWPEFQRWCPVLAVVERERYRLDERWEPSKSFALHFKSETGVIATLHCGGIEDPTGWEGPNVSFAHFDEARRHDTPLALKTLDGRVRIPGQKGELPQLYISTTPKKHWLFDYFGPIKDDGPDPLEAFKKASRVITLLTKDNELAGNLAIGFTANRGKTLSEAEKRVLLEAEWEDVDDTSRFLSSIIWWDSCKSGEVLGVNAPLILAADAGVTSDNFGVIGVGRHPSKQSALLVGYVRVWAPQSNRALDFDEIETEIREVCRTRNVLKLGYDPYQLHQMMTRLRNERVVETVEFHQGAERAIADKNLHDLIQERRIAHDGNSELRQHVDNADKKIGSNQSTRLVKRSEGLKIDLTVALSMAAKMAMQEFFGDEQSLGFGFFQGSANRKLSAV